MSMVTAERYAQILQRLRDLPSEHANDNGHQEADELILEFVPNDIKRAYLQIDRWFE